MDRLARDPCPRWVRRLQAVAVIALVVCLPIALGGALPGSRLAMVAAVAALVLVEWVPRTLSGRWPDAWDRAWLGVWLVLSTLILLQLAPLPSALSRRIGAYPDAFLALADVPIARVSPTPEKTADYWAVFSAYWALAWTVARLRRRDVGRLVAALTLSAAGQAFVGLYALAHGSETILGIWSKTHYLGDATGTFVNRNHFAGLLALCWPLGVAWILLPSRRGRLPSSLRSGLAIQYSLLIGTAIFGSHSRFGLVAAFAGLAVWLALARGRGAPGATGLRVPAWLVGVVPATAIAGALWLGSGHLVERVMRLTQDTDRFTVWSSLADLPARTWVLGAGAGAFSDVFKTVQPIALRTSYAYAHSDWLEFALDFGVVGIAAVAAAAWIWWRRVRPTRWTALHAGALGGLVAVGLHSAMDFDLHVPGTAAAFWAGVGIVCHRRLGAERSDEGPPREPLSKVQATGSAEPGLPARP